MSPSKFDPSRRGLLRDAVLAGAGLVLSARLPSAHAQAGSEAGSGTLITKPIPSTGQRIPVVGLGTNAYGVEGETAKAPLREVIRRLAEVEGSVIDTAPAYRNSEAVLGELIEELGVRDRLFVATKVTAPDDDVARGRAQLEESFRRLRTDKLDLMQVHNLTGADAILPTLAEWKREGRLRYIGITTSSNEHHAHAAELMRRHPLDFVQINYSVDNRSAEREVFPLAQERGVAVLLNVPLGGRRGGSLFGRVKGLPLPPWAAEFGAASWAQWFLKYSLGHPAVTAVIPGTTKRENLEDNLGAGRGALPDAAMRQRIEAFWDSEVPEAAG